jgi:cell division protein FtsB
LQGDDRSEQGDDRSETMKQAEIRQLQDAAVAMEQAVAEQLAQNSDLAEMLHNMASLEEDVSRLQSENASLSEQNLELRQQIEYQIQKSRPARQAFLCLFLLLL